MKYQEEFTSWWKARKCIRTFFSLPSPESAFTAGVECGINRQKGFQKGFILAMSEWRNRYIGLEVSYKVLEKNFPKWIPFNEKLPDDIDEYYLFGGYTYEGRWEAQTRHWSSQHKSNLSTVLRGGYTHWMRIPPEPALTDRI
jgi:hypothetical protein